MWTLKNKKRQSKTCDTRRQLQIEGLESRTLMAANVTASLNNGILNIEGTPKADTIIVRQNSNVISVDGVKIKGSGVINKIQINALGGHDTVRLDANGRSDQAVKVPSIVWGGNGNDTIVGGKGNDVLRGNSGNDMIYGNEGDDWLHGGSEGVDGATVAERDKLEGGPGFDRFSDAFNFSQPVYTGVAVGDIKQTESPTCQTLAALASWVKDHPENRIDVLGNNQYRVRMVGRGSQTVSFDGRWSDNDPMPVDGAPEFWTILMQRARLQSYGVNWDDPKMSANWSSLNSKNGGKLRDPGQALYDFTGWRANWVSIGSADPQKMADALKRGDYLVASSVGGSKKKDLTADGIAHNHAYSIRAVYSENGWKVRLYNPWHSDRGDGKTIDPSNPSDDGFITLTWGQFKNSANFEGYYVA